MKQESKVCARVSFLALTIIVLMFLISTVIGCGGGGDSNPTQPIVTPPDSPGGAVITAFRLQLTDTTINSGGKAIYEYMVFAEKIVDINNDPVSLRFRLEAEIGGQWVLYAGLDSTRIDVRSLGLGSGEFAPQLTTLPPHEEAFSSTMIWWVERSKGSGLLNFVAEVHADYGIICSLAFGLYLHGNVEEPPPPPSCRDLHPVREAIDGYWWDCINNCWVNTWEPVEELPPPPPTCRDLHPIKEAIEGFWWDCVNGCWVNTGEPVEEPPPPDNNLYPTPYGEIMAYFGGIGLQSISLEVYSPGMEEIGFILWELYFGPSGAMTVPLGSDPSQICEFYYEDNGVYTIWATPYGGEEDYQNGALPIGNKAVFTVTVIDG